MARPALVPLLFGALLVVGGCGGAVEETADGAAAAQPAGEGAPPDEGERPGEPGGEVTAGGGEGRPGVPFDQPVFQDIGRDFDEDARRSIEDRCADVCTVAYSVDGDPDDPAQACRISGFSYEPPDEGGFFQIGAEVTVQATCESREIPEEPTEEPTG